MQEQTQQSVFTLEGQSRITMTKVQSVDGFSETSIQLTVEGKKVLISGEKLKVLSFAQGTGNFAASGVVSSVKFGGSKKLSRLFQ